MSVIWSLFFAWLPAPIALAFAGLTAIFIIFLTLRLVKVVLDAIPFV